MQKLKKNKIQSDKYVCETVYRGWKLNNNLRRYGLNNA